MGRVGLKSGIYPLHSAEETVNFGKLVATHIPKNAVIALSGDLGAGKTTFVQGLAFALEIQEPIQSPTFVLLNEYDGLAHFDLYRLKGDSDFINLGFQEYLDGDSICVIEWPERIKNLLPKHTIFIHLSYASYGRNVEVRI